MTPKTKAGRRLLGWLRVGDSGLSYPPIETVAPAITAIEAEAVSAALERLRAVVEGLEPEGISAWSDWSEHRRRVLRAIDEEAVR